MSSRKVLAVILVTLGVVVLAYSGVSIRTRGEPINIGPVHVETTQRHFIPPVAGAVALVGGIVLWFAGSRKD